MSESMGFTKSKPPEYSPESVGGVLRKKLIDACLCPAEADSVLQSIKADEHSQDLADTLDREWDGYPLEFHEAAWIIAKQFAIQYIDEHKPGHFARHCLTT